MNASANGFELQVRASNEVVIPERVIDRAKAMLQALLEKAAVTGLWVYRVTGSGHMANQSHYRMEAELGSAIIGNMLHVKIRASLIPDGTVNGMLQLPKDALAEAWLVQSLHPAIEALNQENWKGVIEGEVRQSMKAGDVPVVRQVWATVEGDVRRNPTQPIRPIPIDGITALMRAQEELSCLTPPPSLIALSKRRAAARKRRQSEPQKFDDAYWLFPQRPTTLSESEEQLMKLQKIEANGFCLTISKGKGHNTVVPPLAAVMLHHALVQAGITHGHFVYQVTGSHSPFASYSRYIASLAPSKEPFVRVHMKCGKSQKSIVTGLLQGPKGTNCDWLRHVLGKSLEALNNENWVSLWKRTSVEAAVEQTDEDRHVSAASTAPAPEAMPMAPVIPQPPAPATVPLPPAPSVIPLQREVYLPLLKDIVQQSPNGVFTGKLAKPLIFAALPDRKRQGLLMGTIWSLERWGLVRQVAPVEGRAAWQVEEIFLVSQGMDLKIQPLPALAKPQRPPVKKLTFKKEAKESVEVKPFVKQATLVKGLDQKTSPRPVVKTKKVAAKKVAPAKKSAAVGVKKTQTSVPPLPLSSDEVGEGMLAFLKLRVKRLQLESDLRGVVQAIDQLTQSLSREDLLQLLLEKVSK